MYSYTILGLRPIENLEARKELVMRCTQSILSGQAEWAARFECQYV